MRLVYDALVWLFFAVMAVGLVGATASSAYLQWTTGFDSGAPFNPLAGLRFIGFLWQHPIITVLGAVGVAGAMCFMLVLPRSSYVTKKNKTAGAKATTK